MKKKLIFGLALLFLATAYTFARESIDLRFVNNFTNTQYENWVQNSLAFFNTLAETRASKVTNYIMGILNSRLNQYNVSNGDTFIFVYRDNPYYSFFILLRITNAKNREYQYKVFQSNGFAYDW